MVLLVIAFSFFAFIAILLFPFLAIVFFLRKKIFKKFIINRYSSNIYRDEYQKNYNDFQGSNNNFIEADYEKKNEKDLDN